MATLQPNSQTLHQTELKIYKLHTPVPLSRHKCQIKITPEPKQPQITLVDTRHQHWIRITKRTQPEARNFPNSKNHITVLRECHDETAREYMYSCQRLPTPALGRPHSARIHRITRNETKQSARNYKPHCHPPCTHLDKRCHNDDFLKLTCSETQCECEWESSRASGDVGKRDARDIHSHGHGHGAYGLVMARI